MQPLVQRKPGAQPGNQNARNHGFYSKMLSREEKLRLKPASDQEGLEEEIAVLRIKFGELLASDSPDQRLINQTAKTLARLYCVKHSLGNNDSSQLKAAVAAVMEEFVLPGSPFPAAGSPAPSPAQKSP